MRFSSILLVLLAAFVVGNQAQRDAPADGGATNVETEDSASAQTTTAASSGVGGDDSDTAYELAISEDGTAQIVSVSASDTEGEATTGTTSSGNADPQVTEGSSAATGASDNAGTSRSNGQAVSQGPQGTVNGYVTTETSGPATTGASGAGITTEAGATGTGVAGGESSGNGTSNALSGVDVEGPQGEIEIDVNTQTTGDATAIAEGSVVATEQGFSGSVLAGGTSSGNGTSSATVEVEAEGSLGELDLEASTQTTGDAAALAVGSAVANEQGVSGDPVTFTTATNGGAANASATIETELPAQP